MPELEGEFTARDLLPHFERCGYKPTTLLHDLSLAGNRTASIAGFAQRPFDSRSACFAAIDLFTSPLEDATACREIGAPFTFLCAQRELLWWSQTEHKPFQVGQPIPISQLEGFFREHRDDFAPNTIYRAKTLGRFEQAHQRSLIDVGLMPVLEREVGETIERLLLESAAEVRDFLGWPKELSLKQGQWLVKAVFWLLGAKMLHDKRVEGFTRLSFNDVDEVYVRLAKHYGESPEDLVSSQQKRRALEPVARNIASSVDLRLATTEALAYVYENTLISDEIRSELGTHSTPSYLVDYIVGRLEPWISRIDEAHRSVFEPACGHAAFLVAATRLLTSLLSAEKSEPVNRKQYLRERICGYDVDDFAVEIARLSLTLTDIPNPNGWSVRASDLFESELIENTSRRSTILLSNTPFENFTNAQRLFYEKRFRKPLFVNRTAEILYRALSTMPIGGVFGIVVPRSLLHKENSAPVRKLILENFELQEICLFPDKVFNFAEQESAVLIGKKQYAEHGLSASPSQFSAIRYRRVRDREISLFRNSYQVTSDHQCEQSRFTSLRHYDLRVPDLENVWRACSELDRLDDYVLVGQGFSHIGTGQPNFPTGVITVSPRKFAGAVQGFQKLGTCQTHELPPLTWLNLADNVINRRRHGTVLGEAQIIMNEAPVQRGPWCLRAMIDPIGRPVKSRFTVFRPLLPAVSLEFLWGLLNSPIANAYAYSHSNQRDIITGTWRKFRVPLLDTLGMARVERAVRDYLELLARDEPFLLQSQVEDSAVRDRERELCWQIDAEVLRLYSLPSALERELLDYFNGWRRVGVPFYQVRYFPEEFDEAISLFDFICITSNWERTNHKRLKLIEAKSTEKLGDGDADELRNLQRLAGLKRELQAAPSLSELRKMEADLRKRKLWRDL